MSAYSVTAAEAQRRLARQPQIQQVLASIRGLERTRLAGWGVDHQGAHTGWVWLTGGDPPTQAAARIAAGHADVEIRTGAAHTHAELLAAQDRFGDGGAIGLVNENPAAARAEPAGPGLERIVVFTGLDMRANGIYIGIDPGLDAQSGPAAPGAPTAPGSDDPAPARASDETLRAKTAQVTELLRTRIAVPFEIVDGRGFSLDADFAGGQAMRTCTSGFAARERGGTRRYGIITAGHCSNSQRMHGINLPYVNGHPSSTADAQFHRIPTGASHLLQDDHLCSNILCDVGRTVARNSMEDDMVCHTGMNSGTSCGTVEDIDFRPTGTLPDDSPTSPCETPTRGYSGCRNEFVKVTHRDLRSCPGDSGGPWYRTAHNGHDAGVAYGIHKGSGRPREESRSCTSPVTFAFFSAIRAVQDFLGVDVLTGGDVTVR